MLYACSQLRALVPPLGTHDLDIQSEPHVLLSLLFGLHQLVISYLTTVSAATDSHSGDDHHNLTLWFTDSQN